MRCPNARYEPHWSPQITAGDCVYMLSVGLLKVRVVFRVDRIGKFHMSQAGRLTDSIDREIDGRLDGQTDIFKATGCNTLSGKNTHIF